MAQTFVPQGPDEARKLVMSTPTGSKRSRKPPLYRTIFLQSCDDPLLQSALVHVNTLLLQEVLAEPGWSQRMTEEDRRALSPLFWTHVNPYGRFILDMDSRLDLTSPPRPRTPPAQEPLRETVP